MHIRPCPLTIDRHLRETDLRGTPMFPCAGYRTELGQGPAERIPWHWHEEVELLLVASGALRLETPGQTLLLEQGEGAFLNAGVLQAAAGAGGPCVLHSLVFDPALIAGGAGSAVDQRYVRPALRCGALACVPLTGADGWRRDAAGYAREAFEALQGAAFGWELLARERLSRLWYLLCVHHRDDLEGQRESAGNDVGRIKRMLDLIHSRYGDPLRVADIASAAAIGERECMRCFRRGLRTTPMNYLTAYRISLAAGLLAENEMTVTEIAQRCGFASPSHFSLTFRRLVGVTPREYRREQTQGREA